MSRALGLLPVGKRREASHSIGTAFAVSLHLAHGNSSRSGVLSLGFRVYAVLGTGHWG